MVYLAAETKFLNTQTFTQIWRFVIVGLINTGIDFVVLNVLSKLTGIGIDDSRIIFLNIVSFSCATTNSYFLNKYWSFGDRSVDKSKQFTGFLLVSIIGVLINTSVLKLSVNLFPGFVAGLAHLVKVILPLGILDQIDLNLNIAKALATGVSLVWNFLGYKLLVFKK